MNTETKTCQNCKIQFTIEPDDFVFYEKIKVPPPTWCPECRLMRRLTWRNDRTLYKRTCDLCEASIVAMYPAAAPFPVYCQTCWYSDKWDGTTYGRVYDFSKPFFTQFQDLMRVVPQIALQVSTSPGSDYVNQVANCKNCYLIASGSDNEDCMYCYRILYSKSTIDASFVEKMESSYECVQCMESFNVKFGDDCISSSHLSFCTDVHGSQDCFMSSNLRHGTNVFRNQKMTKEEYVDRIKALDSGSYSTLQDYLKEFADLLKSRLYKYMAEKNAPGCTGNAIANSTNAKHCFISGNLQDCKYALMLSRAKDSYDINNGCCTMELAYECSTVGVNTYNTKLSADVWPDVRNTTYSQSCRNDVSDLFGCVSLRKKQYCILNKQYSKEDYEALVEKIVAHMDDMPYTDEKGRVYRYGEFFPPEISIYAYNETPAQDYFPKTKTEVEAMGFRWRATEPRRYEVTIAVHELPDHIKDVTDDITKQIVGCAHGGTCEHQCPSAFRITPQELQFYRRWNIALPRLCPNCRHYERFVLTNPYHLWKRLCACVGESSPDGKRRNNSPHFHGNTVCPNEFETSYAPDRPEIIYCESCYNAEVA